SEQSREVSTAIFVIHKTRRRSAPTRLAWAGKSKAYKPRVVSWDRVMHVILI
ncbi:unnamed protein product, partial [Mycena citricolor]